MAETSRFREVGRYTQRELIRDLKDFEREFRAAVNRVTSVEQVIRTRTTVISGSRPSSPGGGGGTPTPIPTDRLLPVGGEPRQVLMKMLIDNFAVAWANVTKADVGLDQVDNTSDEDKPLSYTGRLLRDGRDYGWIDEDYGLITDPADSVMDFGEIV